MQGGGVDAAALSGVGVREDGGDSGGLADEGRESGLASGGDDPCWEVGHCGWLGELAGCPASVMAAPMGVVRWYVKGVFEESYGVESPSEPGQHTCLWVAQ